MGRYGGELVVGTVTKAFVDYWNPIVDEDGDGDLIDFLTDYDYEPGDISEIEDPEAMPLPTEDPEDFGHPSKQQARINTAHKIAWFLEKTGEGDLTWWENVKEGKQDPFEKMKWSENVKGAGQLDSIADEEDQLPDDTIITL